MKPIKVNADYEVVLFTGQLAPKQLNEAIEFLPFFLENRPVLSSKNYAPEFLSYIDQLTGQLPVTQSRGDSENWWGDLKNLSLEKKLNSKITSTEVLVKHQWCEHTFVIDEHFDESRIKWDRHYIVKDPFGMSGQKFEILSGPKSVKALVKKGPVILEPLFNRIHDFSHYIFPDGQTIAYQNFVDSRFQYKGSFYPNRSEATAPNLSFYSEINTESWKKFQAQLETIMADYRERGASGGFSIDSFTYREDGLLKIRPMSEVNYRRTMGRVAFDLATRFAPENGWTLFLLMKPQKFIDLKNKLESLLWTPENKKGVIILSPGDSRFSMLYLVEENSPAGNALIEKLNFLLPSGEFPVKLENNTPGFFG